MRSLLLLPFLIFSFNSFGIFNLKTKEEQKPDIQSKKWLFLSQSCHSCSELLLELKSFCKGKKPSPAQIGFFISGSQIKAMLKKVKDFEKEYEVFSGAPSEFYKHYQVSSSPSLKTSKKTIAGKKAILRFLQKDKEICSS
ncbi:MAG: hypothetical protein GDA46_02150 [Bdellovibrionales bacterium]|nr:hypothetical protein [Bdellovibrionales bacterium]